jgi:hypothetical protein
VARGRVRSGRADNGNWLTSPGQDASHSGHVYIRPATPRLNGKVERSHRIDAEDFYRMLDGVVIDDAGVFNERLREWEDF